MIEHPFRARLTAQGFSRIAGVDEVGRGPLAGPVIAAAVILPDDFDISLLDDSKKLSEKAREALFPTLIARAEVGLASLPAYVIDRVNIRQASLQAMSMAVAALASPPDYALIDGRDAPPDLPCNASALIKGDAKIAAIAAASIIAKVIRDRMMARCDDFFQGYSFKKHKGYGTRTHLMALTESGSCEIHRFSFAPLKQNT